MSNNSELYPKHAWELPIEERQKLAVRRIEEIKRTGQTWLDLGDLALDEESFLSLTNEWKDIEQLERLSLGQIKLTNQEFDCDLGREFSTFKSLSPLTTLIGLRELYLVRCTGVTELDPLESLANLQMLNLSDCRKVTELAPLKSLKNLQMLNLSDCREVTELAPLKSLINLQTLILLGCKGVTELAPLESLTNLHTLILFGCKGVTELAPLESLTNLQTLDLWGCTKVTIKELMKLAEFFKQKRLPNLKEINIEKIESGLSEEVIESGDASRIFRELLATDQKPLNEAKLILLGNGEVGKSHLLDRLLLKVETCEEKDQTANIVFEIWKRDKKTGRPRTRILDCGGQPYLHGSHRFFLGSDYTAYVLVLDATKTAEENNLHYWLRFIAHHGHNLRSGEHSPCIIVLNKCDAVSLAQSSKYGKSWSDAESICQKHKSLMETLSRLQNPETGFTKWHGANVLGQPIYGMGYFHNERVKIRKNSLLKELLNGQPECVPTEIYQEICKTHTKTMNEIEKQLKMAIDKIPKPTKGVRTPLRKLIRYTKQTLNKKTKKKWLSLNDPHWNISIVKTFQLEGDLRQVELPTLRNLGLVHWVSEEDIEEDIDADHSPVTQRLYNPHWVKDPAYAIVNKKNVKHFILSASELKSLWSNLRPIERKAVKELILACRVAFPITRKDTNRESEDLFIPDLLKSIGPQSKHREANSDRWRMSVPFLSDRVLFHFIGQKAEYVENPVCELFRNRIEYPWAIGSKLKIVVTSNLDGGLNELPYLLLTVKDGTAEQRSAVLEQLKLSLEQSYRAEIEKNVPGIREIVWTYEDEPKNWEEWLNWYMTEHLNDRWLDVDKALTLHIERQNKAEIDKSNKRTYSIRRKSFLKECEIARCLVISNDKMKGVNKFGYFWRKANSQVEFLDRTITCRFNKSLFKDENGKQVSFHFSDHFR